MTLIGARSPGASASAADLIRDHGDGRASRIYAVRNEAGPGAKAWDVMIEIDGHLQGAPSMQQLFHRLEEIDHVIWDWNGTLLNDASAIDTLNFLLQGSRAGCRL